jgi:hypothetical protein
MRSLRSSARPYPGSNRSNFLGTNLQTCPREGVAAEKIDLVIATETAISSHHMARRVRRSSANHHPSTTKYLRK